MPGHRERDLIMGAHDRTAVGTPVESSTQYVVLVHVPQGRNAAVCRDMLITGLQLPGSSGDGCFPGIRAPSVSGEFYRLPQVIDRVIAVTRHR